MGLTWKTGELLRGGGRSLRIGLVAAILLVSFLWQPVAQADTTTTTIVDTLGMATPSTTFSVFGTGATTISEDQYVGPQFTLTGETVITEIGGFMNNCGQFNPPFVPDCPNTLPFEVQIRPALSGGGVPDPSTVLATFVLSHDDDPLVYSFESVSTNLTLGPGTYFALFHAQQADDVGGLLGNAQTPFGYLPAVTALGILDTSTGVTVPVLWHVPAAVRILGVASSPPCTIVGTDVEDVLKGTDGDDVICGLSGNDTMRGAGGNDLLIGGDGVDILVGGPGDDSLQGDASRDTLAAKDGVSGNDTADGGGGDADRCRVDPGDLVINCP
jgi:hypothetical protein